MQSSAGGLRKFRDELRMWGYMRGVWEWSGLVLGGKDGSGGGSECHVTLTSCWNIGVQWQYGYGTPCGFSHIGTIESSFTTTMYQA